MANERTLESLYIDIEKGICQINGEDMSRVSRLELCFENGKWSLLISKDELYKQAAACNVVK